MEETFHIDTVCHSGRPSDPRSAKETACYDLLDSLGIAYERVDHDAAMTMELCHAAEGVLHISIGPPEDMERLLGVTPGSATVLALQNDTAGEVALVIDRAVLQAPRFGCHPCINTSSLAFSTQDLTEKLLPALGHAPVLVDLPEDSDA